MTVRIASITFDSTDPEPLARWWAERFDAEITTNMDGFFLIVAGGSLPPSSPSRRSSTRPRARTSSTSTSTPTVTSTPRSRRWVEAGATSLGKRNAGDFYWVTLTDPDGNEFCIAGG